jgi:hypothetical protein
LAAGDDLYLQELRCGNPSLPRCQAIPLSTQPGLSLEKQKMLDAKNRDDLRRMLEETLAPARPLRCSPPSSSTAHANALARRSTSV